MTREHLGHLDDEPVAAKHTRGVEHVEQHLHQRLWRKPVLLWGIAIAIVLLAKLSLITSAANPTPFWDQWDGEAAGLYKPWVEGTWTWHTFVTPHNEHRILPTRVLDVALFEALGQRWDPILEMAINAVLHTLAVVVLVSFLTTALPVGAARPVWIFAAAIHTIPFGWDSTLQGFNTHFYVLLLLTFALLWTCLIARSELKAYLAAIAMAGVLVLTMASGLLGPAVGAAVLLCQRIVCHDRTAPVSLAVILGGIAVGGFLLAPEILGHQALRARSVSEFVVGLGRVQAWPLQTVGRNLASALMPVVMQSPALIALAVAFRNRAADRQAFLVFAGMTAWVWLQAAAFAYARYQSGLGSRYLDILSAGTVLNFTAVVYLWTQWRGHSRTAIMWLAAVWLGAVACGVVQAVPRLYADIQTKIAESKEQERRVRAYLADGDPKVLFDAGPMEIPYPDAARLQALLDDPTIRSFLPTGFVPAPAVNE